MEMDPLETRETNFEYAKMPKDYVVWSMVSITFFNPLFGLVAFYYSIKTRDLHLTGNVGRAFQAAKRSKLLNILSIVTGILMYLIIILVYAKFYAN